LIREDEAIKSMPGFITAPGSNQNPFGFSAVTAVTTRRLSRILEFSQLGIDLSQCVIRLGVQAVVFPEFGYQPVETPVGAHEDEGQYRPGHYNDEPDQ
jgi:hypothetical protein